MLLTNKTQQQKVGPFALVQELARENSSKKNRIVCLMLVIASAHAEFTKPTDIKCIL